MQENKMQEIKMQENRVKPNKERKRVLCFYWNKGEQCPFEGKCHFAHGVEEIKNDQYKTKICKSFHEKPWICYYGTNCVFMHNRDGIITDIPRGVNEALLTPFFEMRITT